MTGFFQKISFKIWLPFALTLSLMMLIVAFYYPREQEKIFRANKERELKELAKTVALGVELSLRADDFQGLKKTIDFVSGTSDFEYVAILVEDSITGKEKVFISYPERPQEEILSPSPGLYVYQKYPFRTADFVGNILISASKEKINELVFNLNRPVYIILPIILLVSLFLFFILARRISKPILQLTRTAKELEAENYEVVIPATRQKDELGELSNAFASLRDSLVEQKDRNKQLTIGLEDEIKLRTSDLQLTQEKLKKINETLEQKVLENTRKNLDLSKSIVEQEKLATIGEISAGIAHDLNTPLGAIKVGTESVHFTFESLLSSNIPKCTDEQLNRAVEIAKSKTVEIYVGGLQLIREKKEMVAYLEATYDTRRESLVQIAEMFVKCRILVQDVQLMEEIYQWDNALDVLELIYNVQIISNLLDTIKTSVDKASKVVKDVRSFIKTESAVDRTRVNLHDNIATVLSIFNYELKRNINLVFDVNQNIHIDGYDIKLFQLWSNLIKNAIEAMEGHPNKNITVRSVPNNGKVDILVENTGIAIDAAIIDKIFKKFFTTKQGKNGTGLGLSIVKNVVDEHGGKISVTSSAEVTTFKVTFNDPIFLD
ncbi:MAG: hypothetical protein RJB31_536 [Bacteroidota bacterium]|jgi:signal transduction histidine kinase